MTEAITTPTTFRVPECNLEELQARIAKLAKRAAKLGMAPPSLLVEGHEDIPLVVNLGDFDAPGHRECKQPDPSKHKVVGYRRYFTIRLVGEAPTIPGWELIAVIKHGDTEVGNVVRVVPEKECPAVYRTATPFCSHCNTARRRLETFVLLETTSGAYKQIGRNCLADFCRSPEAASGMCGYAEYMSSASGLCGGAEDEGFFGMGGRGTPRVLTDSLLAMTARIIRHAGWMSRGQARERAEMGQSSCATADLVGEIFLNPKFFEPKRDDRREDVALREAAKDVQEQDVKLATEAIEWVRAMRPQAETLGDYLHNLLVVLCEETVKKKHFGIACSAIAAYQREMGQRAERAVREKARAESTHISEVGKRDFFQLTVLGINYFESQFGTTYMYRFADQQGNIVVWKASNEQDAAKGDTVIVHGTVKEHGEYKGTKQTVLSRCDLYRPEEQGTCPNCSGKVLPCHRGKNCPSCKKRGLKVAADWFPAEAGLIPVGTQMIAS
ncbi:MAG: hypothetical protein K2R98_19320 [Gemmataceae bacterium]|nr:hypothetical protein [Gemmataceae bacterium]